jgi:hypothetical protein
MVPALLVTPLLPGDPFYAVAWMVPGLAMCAVVLASARHVQPVAAATVLSLGWLALSISTPTQGSLLAQHTAAVQLGAVAAGLVAVVSLVVHRHAPVAPPRRNP